MFYFLKEEEDFYIFLFCSKEEWFHLMNSLFENNRIIWEYFFLLLWRGRFSKKIWNFLLLPVKKRRKNPKRYSSSPSLRGGSLFSSNFLLLPVKKEEKKYSSSPSLSVKKRRKIKIIFCFSFSEGGSFFSMIFSSSCSCKKRRKRKKYSSSPSLRGGGLYFFLKFCFSFSEGVLYFLWSFLLIPVKKKKK